MQNHQQISVLLATYDELDAQTRQQIDDHLATCSTCAATLAAYRQTDHALRTLAAQKEVYLRQQPAWPPAAVPWGRARTRRRAAWRDNLTFHLTHSRTSLLQAAGAGALLLLLSWLLFGLSGWLPVATPVSAATPTVAPAPMRTAAPATTEERTTIRFAINGWDVGNYSPLVHEFETANPDLQVELVTLEKILGDGDVGWVGADFPKVAAVADVIATYIDQPTIEAGLVRNLRPLLAQDATVTEQDYYSNALAAYEWQDGLWALPTVMNVSLIFYDKDAFDEAGVAYPQPGWTWAEFVATAKSVTLRNGDEVQRWGYVESWYSPQPFIESQAGPLFDASTSPVTLRLRNPEVLAALQRYAELYTVHGVSPYQPQPATDAYAESPLINLGQAAMWPDSSSAWRWRSQDRHLGVVPYPTNGSRTNTTQVEAFAPIALSAQSRHPAAAWRWMIFLSSKLPEAYAMGDFLPARKSVAEAIQFWEKLEPAVATTLRYALEHGHAPYYVDPVLNSEAIYHAQEAAFAAILQGQKPVETAMAEVQAVAERELSASLPPPVTATRLPRTASAVENRVTITYIAPYGRSSSDHLYDLAAQFETSHPTLTVQIADALLQEPLDLPKLAQRADCFNWTPVIYEAGGRDLLLPLDALLAADQTMHRDDFYPGLLPLFSADDQLWGLPAAAQPKVIGYNRTLFDRAGVAYPSPTWTTTDFLRLAQALTQGKGLAKQYGFVGDLYDLADFESFLPLWNGTLYDTSSQPPRFRFDDPATVAALAWYVDLAKIHGVRPTFALSRQALEAGSGDMARYEALINASRAAMWSTFVGWGADRQPYHGAMGLAPLPLGPDGQRHPVPMFTFGYYISAQSTQPAACWAWLRFLAQQPTASDGIPARRSVVQSAAYRQQVGEEQANVYNLLLESYELTEEAQVLVQHPWLEGARPLLERAYAQLLAGEVSAAAALAQAQQQANDYRACIIANNAFTKAEVWPTCLPQ